MPLVAATLEAQLLPLFQSPPDNRPDCASSWASAMNTYTAGIIPASTTVSAAATALEAELIGVFDSWWSTDEQSGLTLDPFETAFANFALVVAGGMTAAGYTGTPPPGLVGFSSLLDAEDHATAASNFASKIDTWMRTGIATLIVLPNTVVPWS